MNEPDQKSAVADEYATRSWSERFSPNHEFPYSSGAAFLLHVVLLLILAFWLAKPSAQDRGAVAVEVINISAEPNDGDTQGEGSGGGSSGEPIFEEADPVDETVEIEKAENITATDVVADTQVQKRVIDASAVSPLDTQSITETGAAIDQLKIKQPVAGGGEGTGTGDGAGDDAAGGGGPAGSSTEDLIGALKAAGAGEGDIEFSLLWNGRNDLDLHVQSPRGFTIWYQNRQSPEGGMLDIDANANGNFPQNPVENIFWPDGAAPEGKYKVAVVYYALQDAPVATPFRVIIKYKKKDGTTEIEDIAGTARAVGQTIVVKELRFRRD